MGNGFGGWSGLAFKFKPDLLSPGRCCDLRGASITVVSTLDHNMERSSCVSVLLRCDQQRQFARAYRQEPDTLIQDCAAASKDADCRVEGAVGVDASNRRHHPLRDGRSG